MKSCPVEACKIICDVLVACLRLAQTREGHALPPGYQKYLDVIPDATVEILEKSYDGRCNSPKIGLSIFVLLFLPGTHFQNLSREFVG